MLLRAPIRQPYTFVATKRRRLPGFSTSPPTALSTSQRLVLRQHRTVHTSPHCHAQQDLTWTPTTPADSRKAAVVITDAIYRFQGLNGKRPALDTATRIKWMELMCLWPDHSARERMIQPFLDPEEPLGRGFYLSPREFDLGGEDRSWQTLQDLNARRSAWLSFHTTTVSDLLEDLLKEESALFQCSDENLSAAFYCVVWLRLCKCCLAGGPSHPQAIEDCQIVQRLVRTAMERQSTWKPPLDLLRLILLMAVQANYHLSAMWLLEVAKETHGQAYKFQMELAVFLLGSTLRESSHLGHKTITNLLPQQRMREPDDLVDCYSWMSLRLHAGALNGLVRMHRNASANAAVRQLSRSLQFRLQATLPGDIKSRTNVRLSGSERYAWTVVFLSRLLGCAHSTENDSTRGAETPASFLRWLERVQSRGILKDDFLRSAFHAITLRAVHGNDNCNSADEMVEMIEKPAFVDGCTPGTTSWGWGVRQMLGWPTTLIKPPATKAVRRNKAKDQNFRVEINLLQAHEASLLLSEMAIPKPSTPRPAITSFVVNPLLRVLVAQYPPNWEAAMRIFRELASPRQSIIKESWFQRLLKENKGQQLKILAQDTAADRASDRETIKILLEALLQSPRPGAEELAHAREIVFHICARGNGSKLLLQDERAMYMLKIVRSIKDTAEQLYFWEMILGQPDSASSYGDLSDSLLQASRNGSWCRDFASTEWQHLLYQLAGIRKTASHDLSPNPDISIVESAQKDTEDVIDNGEEANDGEDGDVPTSASPSRYWPPAPLTLLASCVETLAGQGKTLHHRAYSSLLKQILDILKYIDPRKNNGDAQQHSPFLDAANGRPAGPPAWLSYRDISIALSAVHSAVMRDEEASTHDYVVTLLMTCYSWLGESHMVHQIWEGMALATVREYSRQRQLLLPGPRHGSLVRESEEAQAAPQQRLEEAVFRAIQRSNPTVEASLMQPSPLMVKGIHLSILLDSCGLAGHEQTGRRAWEFATNFDQMFLALHTELSSVRLEHGSGASPSLSNSTLAGESEAASSSALPMTAAAPGSNPGHYQPIRHENAWTSWIEFLCRRGYLLEAAEQLDLQIAMARRLGRMDQGPQRKCLRTLMSFAAKERTNHLLRTGQTSTNGTDPRQTQEGRAEKNDQDSGKHDGQTKPSSFFSSSLPPSSAETDAKRGKKRSSSKGLADGGAPEKNKKGAKASASSSSPSSETSKAAPPTAASPQTTATPMPPPGAAGGGSATPPTTMPPELRRANVLQELRRRVKAGDFDDFDKGIWDYCKHIGSEATEPYGLDDFITK